MEIGTLKHKLLELKRYRDTLQNEAAVGAAEITQLEEHLYKLRSHLEGKKKEADELQVKAKRVDAIIYESEVAFRKLNDNAKKLEGVIERELQTSNRSMQY